MAFRAFFHTDRHSTVPDVDGFNAVRRAFPESPTRVSFLEGAKSIYLSKIPLILRHEPHHQVMGFESQRQAGNFVPRKQVPSLEFFPLHLLRRESCRSWRISDDRMDQPSTNNRLSISSSSRRPARRSKAICHSDGKSAKHPSFFLLIMQEMGRHLRRCPLRMTVMLASSLDDIRARTPEYVLAQHQGPCHPPPTTDHGQRLCMGQLQGFATMASSNIHATVGSSQPTYQKVTPATRLWRVFLLPSDLRAAEDRIAAPMSRSVETYEEVQRNLDDIEKAYASGELGFFTAIAAVDCSRSLEKARQQDTPRGLCDLALAVTRFQAQNKAYPSGLQERVPEFMDRVPVDPFDRQPLKSKAVSGAWCFTASAPSKSRARIGSTSDAFDFKASTE